MTPNLPQQHSLDWYRDRLGNITGSCVGKIYGRGRGYEFSKTGYSYLNGVAGERMIPRDVTRDDALFAQYIQETTTTSKAMRIGSEREAEARTLYSIIHDADVQETGCTPHPDIPGFASSPDGLVGADGVLEIKCPSPAVFMEYLTSVKTPSDLRAYNPEYFWQCVSHLMCTGRKWCDFVVYCPYNCQPLHRIRIEALPEYFRDLRPRIISAIKYINSILPAENRIELKEEEAPAVTENAA